MATTGIPPQSELDRSVGYNPFRKRVQRKSDIVLVGVTLAVVLALVLWALLSG